MRNKRLLELAGLKEELITEGHDYSRVIPRDLFNESNLLKCMGRLYICLEGEGMAALDNDGGAFHVEQDESGDIFIANVWLTVRDEPVHLSRPLNSRESWPLYAMDNAEGINIEVFDNSGNLTEEFKEFLHRE